MILHSRFLHIYLYIYLLLCIVTRLRDGSTGVRVAVESRFLGLLQNAHTVSEAHPPYCLMSTWGSSLKVQWQGREAAHLPPPRAEMKNELCCNHTLPLGLMQVSGQLIFALLPS